MVVSFDMSDKVVLVTGGGRGVGDGIVESFLAAGATVEICGRTAPESLREVDGRTATFSPVDVREADQAAHWVDAVRQRRGRVDVVVNNAGGAPFAQFSASSPRFLDKIVALNLMAAAYVSHAAYDALRETGEGVVINITSISARRPSPGTAIYGAAKAGLESLTTSLAVEWAPAVRVNAISSGLVRTETQGAADHYGDAEQVARVAATIPRGVFATPQDIGAAALMLASPLARHITGAVLNVDGGGEIPSFLQHTPNA